MPVESSNDTQIHTQMDYTFARVFYLRACVSVYVCACAQVCGGVRVCMFVHIMLFVFRNCNPLMRTGQCYCYK